MALSIYRMWVYEVYNCLYKGDWAMRKSDITPEPVHYEDLTFAERRSVREAYVEHQEGKCFYCKEPLDEEPPSEIKSKTINWKFFPPNFLQYPVHLQHDHKTGMTEGAVHAYCNAVMWQYERR